MEYRHEAMREGSRLCMCEMRRSSQPAQASFSSTDLKPRVDLFLPVFAIIDWVAQVIAHDYEVAEPTLHRADDGRYQVLHTRADTGKIRAETLKAYVDCAPWKKSCLPGTRPDLSA
jgi:hypothetical protein